MAQPPIAGSNTVTYMIVVSAGSCQSNQTRLVLVSQRSRWLQFMEALAILLRYGYVSLLLMAAEIGDRIQDA
jgi:hypothetical protein